MAARTAESTPVTNHVSVSGRVSGVSEVVLPSGDPIATFRVIVARPPGLQRRGSATSGSRVDVIDCVAWSALLRRRILSLPEDCQVEVEGSLRRRFWRAGASAASRTEIEVTSLRRVVAP